MQIIVKILTAILPYILSYLSKHSDDILEKIHRWIEAKIGDNDVATVRFNVVDENGKPLENAVAEFHIDIFGVVIKKAIGSTITISGFKEGKQKYVIKCDGYQDTEVDIDFKSDDAMVDDTVMLKVAKA